MLHLLITRDKLRLTAWNIALTVATVACMIALVVLVERPHAIKMDIDAISGELLASMVIGISLIFSAVLLGYFLILREWIVSTSSLMSELTQATRKALAQHRELLERTSSNIAKLSEWKIKAEADSLSDNSLRE